jgi:hypothetical protein
MVHTHRQLAAPVCRAITPHNVVSQHRDARLLCVLHHTRQHHVCLMAGPEGSTVRPAGHQQRYMSIPNHNTYNEVVHEQHNEVNHNTCVEANLAAHVSRSTFTSN